MRGLDYYRGALCRLKWCPGAPTRCGQYHRWKVRRKLDTYPCGLTASGSRVGPAAIVREATYLLLQPIQGETSALARCQGLLCLCYTHLGSNAALPRCRAAYSMTNFAL